MENPISEKKTIQNLIKDNLKIILSFFFTVIIVLIVYFWFDQASENKKNELSESFIDAKILLTKKKTR